MYLFISLIWASTSHVKFNIYYSIIYCIYYLKFVLNFHFGFIQLSVIFTSVCNFSRPTRKHGAQLFLWIIYFYQNVNQLCVKNISVEISFESCAISYDKNTCIVVIYRSPGERNLDVYYSVDYIIGEHHK